MIESNQTSANVNFSGPYFEQDELLMSEEGYIAASVTLFFIGFFGFFLNIFVVLLIWRNKQLWTPINVILFNLVCSDLSVSLLGNPWTFMSALSHKWIFGRFMCTLYGFFMALLGISAITTLTVLAFERYLIVAKPFKNHNLATHKESCLILLGIWAYSFLLTFPPLVGWGNYVNEAANISCSVNWEEQTLNSKTYIAYLFIFGLFVPLVIIVFCYIKIIHVMKQNNLRTGKVSKAERKVIYMVFIMIVAFLMAWFPYAVFALVSQYGKPNFISPAAAVIPALMAKSSICYNPIIYIGLNTQFRQLWLQIFCPNVIKSKQSSIAEVNENTQGITNSRFVVSYNFREKPEDEV